MIRQLLIIFGCLAVGEIVVRLTGIAIPSSIIGMLLLTALLQMKVVKLEWVKGPKEKIEHWASRYGVTYEECMKWKSYWQNLNYNNKLIF